MSPVDTDLERRVTATLRAKAAQVAPEVEPFDPAPGPPVAAPRSDRRRMLVAAAVAALLVVSAAAAVILLAGSGDDHGPTVPAVQPPVARLEIDALPNLKFAPAELATRPGLNEIVFRSSGGTHTLVFADPALHSFRLSASHGDAPVTGYAELEPGRDYVVYCDVPGHREAGAEAVIHVTGDAAGG
jgi:hypothetical protein